VNGENANGRTVGKQETHAMTTNTSSAEPWQLIRYANTLTALDSVLVSQAGQLRGALEHFEARCREPAFRLTVAPAADQMAHHGREATVVDNHVRLVGQNFLIADNGGLWAFIAGWIPPWLIGLPWTGARLPLDGSPRLNFPVRWGSGWMPWPAFRNPTPVVTLPPTTGIPTPTPTPAPTPTIPPTGETELGKLLQQGEQEKEAAREKIPLRQDQAIGDSLLLDARRYSSAADGNTKTESAWFGPINSVRDHIRAYGCYMTSLAMLLRDRGRKDTVTDLYRANYQRATGRSIEEDLARDDDRNEENRDIVLSNLYLQAGVIDDVTGNSCELANGERLPTSSDATDALVRNLNEHGSVVIQVNSSTADGHWIVVDSYDPATGTFTVRDPAAGLVTGVTISPSGKYKPRGPVNYIREKAV
jgi:hypothetical protein